MMEKGSVAKPWADFEVRRECAVRVGSAKRIARPGVMGLRSVPRADGGGFGGGGGCASGMSRWGFSIGQDFPRLHWVTDIRMRVSRVCGTMAPCKRSLFPGVHTGIRCSRRPGLRMPCRATGSRSSRSCACPMRGKRRWRYGGCAVNTVFLVANWLRCWP